MSTTLQRGLCLVGLSILLLLIPSVPGQAPTGPQRESFPPLKLPPGFKALCSRVTQLSSIPPPWLGGRDPSRSSWPSIT